MKNPFVSVIVPVYNTEQFLSGCIESVLGQSFDDFELLIVDDGSTDKSIEIAESYARQDARVKVLHSNAGCVSVARSMGLENATGEYVYFVDSDDYLEPEGLTKLVEVVKSNDDIDFCQGSIMVDNQSTGQKVKASRFDALKQYDMQVQNGNDYLKNMTLIIAFPVNSLIKRKFLIDKKIDFPADVPAQEDLVFIIHLLAEAQRAIFVNTYGYSYRFGRAGSLTTSSDKTHKKRKLAAIVRSSAYLRNFAKRYPALNDIIETQITNNITGVLGGLGTIGYDKDFIKQMKAEIPKLKLKSEFGRRILALIYNFSAPLAYKVRQIKK